MQNDISKWNIVFQFFVLSFFLQFFLQIYNLLKDNLYGGYGQLS